MAELSTNVRYIKGIGETRAKALEKLGITTLRDLISYFPRSYEDRTLTRPIRDLTEGENVCVRAMIAADPTAHRIPGGRTIVRTRAVDETGTLDVVFFNQEYRKNSLHRGEIYIFYGKVEGQRRHQLVNPLLEPEGRQHLTGCIMLCVEWTVNAHFHCHRRWREHFPAHCRPIKGKTGGARSRLGKTQ